MDEIVATRASTSGKLVASHTFAPSSWIRWTKHIDSDAGDLTAMRVHHTIPASGEGSARTNYDETAYGYHAMGWRNKTRAPDGTITRHVFDIRGHVIKTYIGTNDTGATDEDPIGGAASGNNMVLVTENEYDNNAADGDGNLTKDQATAPTASTTACKTPTTGRVRSRSTRIKTATSTRSFATNSAACSTTASPRWAAAAMAPSAASA